jgi:hypothetical protein
MTTASSPRPYSVWLTHNELPIWIGFVSFGILNQLTIRHNWIINLGSAVFAVGIIAALAGAHRHKAVLCEACIADFPLDGEAQATKHVRWLRFIHHGRLRARSSMLLLALLLVSFYPPLSWVIVAAWFIALADVRANGVHRRLEPWCPWCRNGGHDVDCLHVAPVPMGRADR